MSPHRPPRGFTLVELLVVIVIIALLAALITPAVMAAMRAAKRTQISAELSQLHSAVEAYKAQYGSYPPSNVTQLKAHLQQVFINIDTTTEFTTANLPAMDNAQILVFALKGYSPDKRRPLSGSGERKPFFDFKPERLVSGRYTAPNTSSTPYVYFDCSRYPTANSPDFYTLGTGESKPYKNAASTYANAKSFQIISTGLDNEFGTKNKIELFNGGSNKIEKEHMDNLTNFSEGKPLIDYIDR